MTGPLSPTGDRGCSYLRVSHGDTEENTFRRNQDPTAQRTMAEQWAARHGKSISRWYMDVEGRNPRDMAHKRHQFQQLLRDVQAGLWDWVVVDSQDRIDPADNAEMGHYIHLFRQSDCELWSVDASQGKDGLLTSTDMGAVFSTTVGSVTSAADLKERGKRQVSRKRENAKKGEWQGGYVPYGFDVVCVNGETRKEVWRVVIEKMVPTKDIWHRFIVHPDGRRERCDGKDKFPKKNDWEKLELAPSVIAERIEIVREIFALFASGAWTVRGLCKRLNQRHIDPVTGEGWYHTRLQPMLQNPVYHLGQTVWGKKSHGKNAQYVGGEYVVPTRRKGRPLTGRKNKVEDWVFPPAGTALVTKELFDEAQARITGRPEFKRGLRDERLWLAGLVVCDRCDQKMSGKSQGGLSYYCTTYAKFGVTNPSGCRLHMAKQEVIEEHVNRYLDDIEPELRALLSCDGQPALVNMLHARFAVHREEFMDIIGQMADFLERCEVSTYQVGLPKLFHLYHEVYTREQSRLETDLTEAKGELRRLVENLSRIPADKTEAIEVHQELVEEADQRVKELKGRLVPLWDRLAATNEALNVLEAGIAEAQKALQGDDLRRKAMALRKVVVQIRLTFQHYEHRCRDRRAKAKTAPRSSLAEIEFVPVLGDPKRYEASQQTSTVATSPARG
jgi:DNA invertase Pin-like site-specific DNA recombinase